MLCSRCGQSIFFTNNIKNVKISDNNLVFSINVIIL